MATKLRWTLVAVTLFLMAGLLPSSSSACAVCRTIPVYFPDGGGFTEGACLFGWTFGSIDCIEFTVNGRSICGESGWGCNEMELEESDEATAVASRGQTCQAATEIEGPSQQIRVLNVR